MSTVTMTVATPCVVTHTAHGLTAGRMLGLATTGNLPTGLNALDVYYPSIIDTNSYYLSRTAQGAAKAITNLAVTFNASTDIFAAVGHGLDIGDPIRLTATTIPAGFAINTDYFIHATSFTADQFRLCASKGGTVLAGTTAGSAVLAHTLISTTGSQSGTQSAAAVLGSLSDYPLPLQNGHQDVTLSNVPLPVGVLLTNIVSGSRVRVSKASDNSELYLGTPGTLASFATLFSGNVYVDVRKKGYIPYRQAAIITSDGLDLYVSQVADTVVV